MFDREITVYVTANTPEERELWSDKFQDFFKANTVVRGRGTWEGKDGLVGEQVVLVSHLFEHDTQRDWTWNQLDELVQRYKREAGQEAVLLVTCEVRGTLQ